jgi:integrase
MSMTEQFRTVQGTEISTQISTQSEAVARPSTRRVLPQSKNSWASRLTKRSRPGPDGTLSESTDYYVRFQIQGRQEWFNVGPAHAAGAKRAKEIYTFLRANGWEATIKKYKPTAASQAKAQAPKLTLGAYVDLVKGTGLLAPKTLRAYQSCLRLIASEIFNLSSSTERFDYKAGGSANWAGRVDSIQLSKVRPELVDQWRAARLTQAGSSQLAIQSAKRTINAYVRNARSLFSARIQKKLKSLTLPAPLPFDGVEMFENGSMKYFSRINPEQLIADARRELKAQHPQSYKIFLLAMMTGLRRHEIDLLEWEMIDWRNNCIQLRETRFLKLKTRDSAGILGLHPAAANELREMKNSSMSDFVITSRRDPRPDVTYGFYRCKQHFDHLADWLRGKGINANKPIHELRKECGSAIVTEKGIYAASRFLRHTDISTTNRHYVDYKGAIHSGLGQFLDNGSAADQPEPCRAA